MTAGLRPACEHGARLVAGGRIVRHGRAPHLAARLASEAAGEAAVRDVAQSGACAGRDCGTGLHDVGGRASSGFEIAGSLKQRRCCFARGRGSQGTDARHPALYDIRYHHTLYDSRYTLPHGKQQPVMKSQATRPKRPRLYPTPHPARPRGACSRARLTRARSAAATLGSRAAQGSAAAPCRGAACMRGRV